MRSHDTAEIYQGAGFGRPTRRGSRPAVLVVDFTYGFTDTAYPTASDMGREIAATRELLDGARKVGVPIAFTTISYEDAHLSSLPWLRKAPGLAALRAGTRLVEVDERLARRSGEPLVAKLGASAFFGTGLGTILASWRADTLIVTGATTSGCVRASVVDAVQSGYDVLVPEPCVADRAEGLHAANLFDMRQKYADAVTLEDVVGYLEALPTADCKQ
jgi:nicotinamidase-related amidase